MRLRIDLIIMIIDFNKHDFIANIDTKKRNFEIELTRMPINIQIEKNCFDIYHFNINYRVV